MAVTMYHNHKDQGWAWLVVIAAHICTMIVEGLIKSLGIMLPTLTTQFVTQTWLIGSILGLMGAVGGITALLAGPLNAFLTLRAIVMGSGVLSAAALTLCSFTDDVMWLAACLILAGISMEICYVSALGVLGDYFDHYFATANSIAYSGSLIGVMLFAPLSQSLLEHYGWRGTVMILGSVTMHLTLCGAIFRPVPREDTNYSILQSDNETSGGDNNHFGYHDLDNKTGAQTCYNLRNYVSLNYLDLLLTAFADEYTWIGWVIYVVPHAEAKGFTPYQSASISTVGGCSALVGMIMASVLIDKQILKPGVVKNLSLICMGLPALLDPLFNTLPILMVATVIFGLGVGAVDISVSAFTKVVVGTENLVQGIACVTAVSTVARLATSSITGGMLDVLGSYDVSFMIMGAIPLSAAVFSGLLKACSTIWLCIER